MKMGVRFSWSLWLTCKEDEAGWLGDKTKKGKKEIQRRLVIVEECGDRVL